MIRTAGAVLFAAVLSVVFGCEPGTLQESEEPYQSESTRRMVERLEALPDSVELRLARSMNRERVEYLSTIPVPRQLAERFDFRRLVAGEKLRAGDLDGARAAFDTILMEMEQIGPRIAPAYRRSIREFEAALELRRVLVRDCLQDKRHERCVFPVSEVGRTGSPEALQRAIEVLRLELEDSRAAGEDQLALLARWLYNLAHRLAGTWPEGVEERYRIGAPFPANPSIPDFPEIAPELGVDVESQAGYVVLDDFTGDGKLDIMTSSFHFTDQLRFFVNQGDGTFEDRTDQAGLRGLVGGLQLKHADYDNDGDLDVFILRGGWERQEGQPNSLLRNNGDGTFDDVTEAAGLLEYGPTAAGAWGDYDNDGWLDLIVGAEAEMRSTPPAPHPTRLYHNNRDGTFTDVAPEVGLGEYGFVKASVWGDYDNDGWLDLYLVQFDEPNRLFRNSGDWPGGRFEDVSEEAGVQAPRGALPGWFWDYDNDGWLDILALSYEFTPWFEVLDVMGEPHGSETTRLYRNRGDGTFEDVTEQVGLDRVFYTMGSEFGDLDNDGWLDFYAGTGMPPMAILFPNHMFRNRGGERFEDVSAAGFAHLAKGHGGGFADLDEDGDQDFYAVTGGANQGDRHRNVLHENPGNDNAWVTLAFQGVQTNRSAIGARVAVHAEMPDGPRTLHRTVGEGSSFGGSSLQLEIGLGNATAISRVVVYWPTSGTRSEYRDVPLRRAFRIIEGDPELHPVPLTPVKLGGGER